MKLITPLSCFRFALFLPLPGIFGWATFIEDPLLRFDFQESQCINDTVFPNLGLLSDISLLRNASTTSYSTGNFGLERRSSDSKREPVSSRLYGSVTPMLTLLEEEDNSTAAVEGISIGLWLRSLQNDDLPSPILTIGRAGTASATNPNDITECDRRQIDLQLTLRNSTLTLLYRTSDPFFEPCQRLRLDNISLPHDKLAHVAIVLAQKRQQVFVNGKANAIMKEPFDPSLTHWSKAGVMQLFSYHDQTPWDGRLYRLEVYESAWDQEDVHTVMSQGLPPALPHAFPTTYRIYEDAEILPGSHSTEWYEHPPMFSDKNNDLSKLHLPLAFLDDDVEMLLKSKGINSTKAPKVFTYISKLPSQGSLYQLDGSRLSPTGSGPNLVPLLQPSVVFIPEHNTYSALPGSTYSSIDYCVALQEIISSTQCLSTATIRIVIDSVNDPPVALLASDKPYMVQEGIIEERLPLQLKGSDVDEGDIITAFEIITPPRLGYLYLSVPVRREDGLFHGTLLSDLDFIVPGSEALVEYRYNDPNTLIRDLVVWDSFDFRVRDSHGSWSVPTRVQIQVVSGVAGSSQSQSVVVKEGSATFVPLEGLDQSGLNRSVGFFLESVPELEDAFILGNEDKVLPVGTLVDSVRIPSPYEEVAGIRFESASKLCEAKKTATASVGYRVVAYEEDGRISSVSSLIDQNITVECKIKPIGLALSQDNFTTRVFISHMDDPCSGFIYNASQVDGTTCESAVIIDGIKVLSDPTHTDRAMVFISSTRGRLTLNQEYRSQLRLLEGQAVMRPVLKFLALPSDLDDILAHLHFQSRAIGPDQIQISIKYGHCPESNSTTPDPFRCFSIQKSIQINVLPALPIEKEMLFETFPWVPLPFTFTMILLMKFKGKLRAILAVKGNKKNDEDTTVADTTSIRWKQFYDDSTGFFYYLNLEDGTVTWDPPLDEDFIASEEAVT